MDLGDESEILIQNKPVQSISPHQLFSLKVALISAIIGGYSNQESAQCRMAIRTMNAADHKAKDQSETRNAISTIWKKTLTQYDTVEKH